MTIKKEPKIRKDGKCYVCKENDAYPGGKLKNGVVAAADPFCSAVCCQQYYGVKGNIKGTVL